VPLARLALGRRGGTKVQRPKTSLGHDLPCLPLIVASSWHLYWWF
jgi:hypothetical protein